MLEVKNISKKFGNKKVLDNISLRVDPNQTIALVGRNGSGKSTLLKTICGLLVPDSGEISKNIKDYEVSYVSTSERSFFHRLSVIENLNFFFSFYCPEYKKRNYLILEKLEEFRLEKKATQEFFTLSSGEKKKLSIIRAMLKKPKILLLDEYSTSLDYVSRIEAKELLSSLQRKNPEVAIIFSTHFFEEIENFASDVMMLSDNGQIKFKHLPENSKYQDIKEILANEL